MPIPLSLIALSPTHMHNHGHKVTPSQDSFITSLHIYYTNAFTYPCKLLSLKVTCFIYSLACEHVLTLQKAHTFTSIHKMHPLMYIHTCSYITSLKSTHTLKRSHKNTHSSAYEHANITQVLTHSYRQAHKNTTLNT